MQSLTRLHSFLIDAFSPGELAVLVEQWNRQVASRLPNIRAVSMQEYAHAVVEEVWRRRMWLGEDGLLTSLARGRPRRARELERLRSEIMMLDAPLHDETPLAKGRPAHILAERPVAERPPALRPRVHLEVIHTSRVDLLSLIGARLIAPETTFWMESQELFRHLVPSAHSANRLRLQFEHGHVLVDAWPHLVRNGQVVEGARLDVQSPVRLFYCPKGRTVRPEYRIDLRPRRCTLSGVLGAARYELSIESSARETSEL